LTVADICCGTGTIGQIIAPQVGQVIGIEMSEEAIADAKANALLNSKYYLHYH
jgi:tRNA/tmRNA/rRNA uracil-C5-methylase (TrmA/RlmC/RlmD family)